VRMACLLACGSWKIAPIGDKSQTNLASSAL